jgi:hypothetical protein
MITDIKRVYVITTAPTLVDELTYEDVLHAVAHVTLTMEDAQSWCASDAVERLDGLSLTDEVDVKLIWTKSYQVGHAVIARCEEAGVAYLIRLMNLA